MSAWGIAPGRKLQTSTNAQNQKQTLATFWVCPQYGAVSASDLAGSDFEVRPGSYAYFSKHIADESSFGCDGGPIECRMDIHVRRMAIKHGRSDGSSKPLSRRGLMASDCKGKL